MDKLFPELWKYIITYVSIKDRYRFSLVCKLAHSLTDVGSDYINILRNRKKPVDTQKFRLETIFQNSYVLIERDKMCEYAEINTVLIYNDQWFYKSYADIDISIYTIKDNEYIYVQDVKCTWYNVGINVDTPTDMDFKKVNDLMKDLETYICNGVRTDT